MKDLYSKLAKYEAKWWKAHHRKDKKALTENMAKLYQLLFGISYEQALKSVKYRIKAAEMHDIAEELEDNGNQKEADLYWDKVEEWLKKHFEVLMRDIKNRLNSN